jgi:hypothetical protein
MLIIDGTQQDELDDMPVDVNEGTAGMRLTVGHLQPPADDL